MTERTFRVGFTGDLRAADGTIAWGDISEHLLVDAGVEWDFLPVADRVTVEQLESYDALLVGSPRVEGTDLMAARQAPQIIARFGVGVDGVDLAACTERGVIVTNTPDGARKPVAQAALALTLATVHHLSAKDIMVRLGNWDDKLDWNGRSLNGATIGIIGLGNIGVEFARLVRIFDVSLVAFDPYQRDETFAELDVARSDLDGLLAVADVLVIFAPLTPETHHLIDSGNIGRMKTGAYLINIARGEIVQHEALVSALRDRRLAGAGLDVFEIEPLPSGDPLIAMPNVVLAPHALSWTDEMARGNGASAIGAILNVRDGELPPFIVNRGVHPRFATAHTEDDADAEPLDESSIAPSGVTTKG